MQIKEKTKLSPSRMKDLIQCPKLFYYKSLGISSPPTIPIAKGVICHSVFEIIFDHPKSERDKSLALKYIEPAINVTLNPYSEKTDSMSIEEINLRDKTNSWLEFEKNDLLAERKINDSLFYKKLLEDYKIEVFIEDCIKTVTGWFSMENPMKFDPMEREYYISGNIGDVDVHGVIDRLDKVVNNKNETAYYISDYKTGNPPSQRFIDNTFFQLEVYGCLVKEVIGVDVKELRLIYVKENKKEAVLKKAFTDKIYRSTKKKIIEINSKINEYSESNNWPTKKQTLCGWCFFQTVCPEFNKNTENLTPEEIAGITGGILKKQ
jgi:putative RecB family exonuclease